MKTEISKYFNHDFFLSEQELRRMYDMLAQQMKREEEHFYTHIELKFSNNVVAERSSLDEVFLEENSGVWKIIGLSIKLLDTADSWKEKTSIRFEFGKMNDYDHGTIRYDIKGVNRDWIYITSSLLEERIKKVSQQISMRRIGQFIWRNFPSIFLTISWLSLLTIILVNAVNSSLKPTLPPLGAVILGILILLFVSVGIYASVRYFPPNIFYWGDYIKFYERQKAIGKFILIGVLFSILLGVTIGILSNYLTITFGIGH